MAKQARPRPSNKPTPAPRVAPMRRNVTIGGKRYLCLIHPPVVETDAWIGECAEAGCGVKVEAESFVEVDQALQAALKEKGPGCGTCGGAQKAPESPSESPETESPAGPTPEAEAAESKPEPPQRPVSGKKKRRGKRKPTPKRPSRPTSPLSETPVDETPTHEEEPPPED